MRRCAECPRYAVRSALYAVRGLQRWRNLLTQPKFYPRHLLPPSAAIGKLLGPFPKDMLDSLVPANRMMFDDDGFILWPPPVTRETPEEKQPGGWASSDVTWNARVRAVRAVKDANSQFTDFVGWMGGGDGGWVNGVNGVNGVMEVGIVCAP